MRSFFIVLSLFWSSICFAQTASEPIPFAQFSGKKFTKTLKTLNRSYGLKFSFNPDALEEIVVPEIGVEIIEISDFLKLCLSESGFDFELISDTYAIVPLPEEVGSAPVVKRRNFALSGEVRDRISGESLPFASISIRGTTYSTTSNVEGRFTLLQVPTDTAVIEVQYLGYRSYVLQLVPGEVMSKRVLQMDRQERNLPSVQITAPRQDFLKISKGVSQYSINPNEISKLPNIGEHDLFAAMRWLPGVANGPDNSAGFRIRAGNSDENLTLFDGITVYHIDHLFGFLSAFNANVVKNARLSKGGFDARFGGRSSGLLELTGIDGDKKHPRIQLEANMLSFNVLAELPIVENKASLVFAYRRAYTTIVQSTTYKNIFNNIFNSSVPNLQSSNTDLFDGENQPEFYYYDLNAKFNFNPTDKDAISLSYYEGQDDLNIEFTGESEGIRRVSSDATRWGNRGGSVKWSRKWNKRFFSYLIYGISRYRSNLDAEVSFFFSDDELFSRRFFDQRTNVNDNTFRFDNNFEISANTSLDFGYWHTDYRIDLQAQDQDFIFQDSVQNATLDAGYFQINQKIDKLQITAGLRASAYTGVKGPYLEPRFSLEYRLSDRITLKAATGRYYQMIRRLNERSLYFSIPETWALSGESTVPVLKSDHFIIGSNFKVDQWVVDIEAYHKSETGVVDFLLPEFGRSSGRLDQFAIDGRKRVFGADFLIKRSFVNQSVMFAYTLLRAESKYDNVNDGEYFQSLNASTHNFSTIYNLEHGRWDFSGAFVLTSGRPYTPVLGTYIVTLGNGEQKQYVSIGGINSVQLAWYHRLDVSAGYTVPLRKGVLQLGASIYNVYNNLAVKFIDYYEIPEEGTPFYTLGRREILTLGFTPSLFLKLKL